MAEAVQLPTDKLGLGMGGIPSLPQQFSDAKTENTNAMKELDTAKADSSKARLEGKEKISTIQDMAPKPPELEKLPQDFKHQGMSDKDMTDSMQTMFFFAALGGAMTRTPMTAALNAFSGALKGMVQGDQELFKRETATFDRHLKTAMTKNNEAMAKYKLAFEKHKGDLGAAMQEIQLEAAAHNDTVTGALARANNAKAIMSQIATMAKADAQMQQTQARMDAMVKHQDQQFDLQNRRMDIQEKHQIAAEASKGWQVFQKPDGTMVRVNAITGDQHEIAGTAGLHKPSAKGGSAGAMTAIQATMYTDVATGYFRMDKLKQMANETGELPGGSPFLQSHMKNDGLVSAVRGWGVNKTLPEGFQQTDALLLGVAFDIASARSGGRGQLSDAKIREVTRQMPLSSDAPDARSLKYELIENQLHEANNTLPAQFQYDPATKGPKGQVAPTQPAATPAAPAGAHQPFADPEKEKRYQEWKAQQGGG